MDCDDSTRTKIQRRRVEVPSLAIVANAPTGEISAELGLAPLVVGSAPSAGLRLDVPDVSRQHCSLTITPRGVLVRDLGSKNGTFISGIEIDEAILPLPNVLRVGDVDLRLRVTGAPSEVPLSVNARFGEALGGSVVMRALFALLERVAPTDKPVLLLGEAGTGKELLAQGIHAASARRDGPFVVFDASAVSPGLVESELFGHVKGSFTGASHEREGILAAAKGGTLFIDELGELPLDLQPRLLRVLEAKQFRPVGATEYEPLDARIVAATNRDLPTAIAEGSFRQDLYYRLAVIEAHVPPLRERRDDIELLVERLLAKEVPPRTTVDLAPGTLALLVHHDWPGNVRELKNTLARLTLYPDTPDRAFDLRGVEAEARGAHDALLAMPWRDARERILDRFEASYVRAKLAEHGGNTARTCAAMGISRQMLHRLITRHGLRGDEG